MNNNNSIFFLGAAMALLQNILGCFTESSESKYICRGDVCVLRDQKKSVKKTTRNKRKQSSRNFFTVLSSRRASSSNV
ncbi:hypothetical protein GQ457_01G006290 [Hibiscus cannabinus]